MKTKSEIMWTLDEANGRLKFTCYGCKKTKTGEYPTKMKNEKTGRSVSICEDCKEKNHAHINANKGGKQ
jgi:hypothetical protein